MRLCFTIVFLSGTIAVITDLLQRRIHRKLTMTVLLGGIIYNIINCLINKSLGSSYSLSIVLYIKLIAVQLIPLAVVMTIMLVLFWLGYFGGGDGHFLISITPWMGLSKIIDLFVYLFVFLTASMCTIKFFNRKRYNTLQPIPAMPYIFIAALFALCR